MCCVLQVTFNIPEDNSVEALTYSLIMRNVKVFANGKVSHHEEHVFFASVKNISPHAIGMRTDTNKYIHVKKNVKRSTLRDRPRRRQE